MSPETQALPVLTRWETFLEWLLPTLEKFPKKIRFTLTNRIENLAIDMIEDLVEARYSKQKGPCLKRCNLRLEKIRLLLRLCHTLKHLPNRPFEHAMRELHEVGKMVGGWIRSQEPQ